MTYPEVADNLITSGLVRFDVRARTENRAEFNIEMQRATHRFLEDRMLLYNAALMIHGKRELDSAEKLKSMGKKESWTAMKFQVLYPSSEKHVLGDAGAAPWKQVC